MDSFRTYIESESPINSLVQSLKEQYPGLVLFVDQNAMRIHVGEIKVPKGQRGQGVGTKVMQAIQRYAQSVGLPIVLSPSPEPRMKARLLKFYRNLGFVPNQGRNKDYTLSSFFGTNWLWRPRQT